MESKYDYILNRYGKVIADKLNVVVSMNGTDVHVIKLSPELQADYLINTDFNFFRSKACKLWRVENLYFIITKDGQKRLFKANAAQEDFIKNYYLAEKPYKRILILKSRQLGMTTAISILFLDEIIWNPNTEALQVAHTLKDAGELFNKKISYAVRNLYPCVMQMLDISQNQSKKLQLLYDDADGGKSASTFSVSNSGRSSTLQLLHISELGKLSKLYLGRAEEIITGTLPALVSGGRCIIESTAEGQANLWYEMYMKAMKRKEFITPELSNLEFYPLFYPWMWDKEEIARTIKNTGIIPISSMKECEINWLEFKEENNLSDEEITFYYSKFIAANEDVDKLHQEFPTTVMEAFIGSGSNYFSLRRISEFYEKCDDNYKRYSFINNEFILDDKGDLYIYDDVRQGRNYVIGADVAEGLENGDYTVAVVLGYDKQVKALYRGHIEPDEFANLLKKLGKRFNTAMLAIEFNKDGNWVNTEVRNSNYPNIYVRTVIDDITREPTRQYGWLTNKKNRDFMLGEAKKHFNSTEMINCRPLLEELMVFVRNKNGKAAAANGKHDDITISWAIAIAVLQGREEKIEQPKKMGVLDAIFANN